MGGKKKGGGKKGDGGDDDKYDPAQMTIILGAQVQSLKERLASEQERRDNARATIEAKRVGEQDILKQINECKKKTEGIVVQMTWVWPPEPWPAVSPIPGRDSLTS
jgi:hypothetical protein